jgi:hypothetical protein
VHLFTAKASSVQYVGNIISLHDAKVMRAQILVHFDHVQIHSIFNTVLLAPSDICATLYMYIHTHTHTHTHIYIYIYIYIQILTGHMLTAT